MNKIISRLAVMIVAVAFFVPILVGAQTAPTFTRDLGVGSSGSDVTQLQTFLESKGYLTMPRGVAKGYYGSATRNAVRAWQKEVGLPTVGRFGPASRAKVATENVAIPNVPTRTGATPVSDIPGCVPGAYYSYISGVPCSSAVNDGYANWNFVSGLGNALGATIDGTTNGVTAHFTLRVTPVNGTMTLPTISSFDVVFVTSSATIAVNNLNVSVNGNPSELVAGKEYTVTAVGALASTSLPAGVGTGYFKIRSINAVVGGRAVTQTMGLENFKTNTVAFVSSGTVKTPSTKSYGDANGDGKVDFSDMTMYAQNSGGAYNAAIDFNGDGVVNVFDLAILSNNYNKTVGKITNITAGDLTTTFARASSISTMPGDATGDRKVDFEDLVKLAQSMNTYSGQTNFNSAADFNRDNVVDVFDLAILSNNYNKLPVVQSQPIITITSPNGGETIQANSLLNATWNYTGQKDEASHTPKFAVEILNEQGQKIAHATNLSSNMRTVVAWSNTNSFTIPLSQSLVAGKYKLLVTVCPGNGDPSICVMADLSGQVSDQSDNWFTVVSAKVAGDVNGDGKVDRSDYAAIIAIFGSKSTDSNFNKAADLDNNNTIGNGDLGYFLGNFGSVLVKGDVNGDGAVNKTDLDIYGTGDLKADLNYDGKVDFSDLTIIAQNYNSGPELGSKMPGYAGDATNDGHVDFNDLVKVAQAFNSSYGQAGYNLLADFNLDGKVDYIDQGIMAKNYNTVGPMAAAQRPGDANGDGLVNSIDLARYTAAQNTQVGQTTYDFTVDFNRDGKVDFSDMVVISQNYNTPAPAVQGASASCVVITNTLSKGSTDATSGGEVTVLQAFLETQGFTFPDKGVFGALTENAVASWQATNGISSTGTVGPLTREAIRAKSCR